MRKEIPVTEITTANSDTTIYKRTTGRVVKVIELTIVNHNTTTVSRVRIWDGPSTDARLRYDVRLAPEESVVITDIYRQFKYGDLVAQATAVNVSISGKIDEEFALLRVTPSSKK